MRILIVNYFISLWVCGLQENILHCSTSHPKKWRRHHDTASHKTNHCVSKCTHTHHDGPQVLSIIRLSDDNPVPKDCLGRDLELSTPQTCIRRSPASSKQTVATTTSTRSKSSSNKTNSTSTSTPPKNSIDASSLACLVGSYNYDSRWGQQEKHSSAGVVRYETRDWSWGEANKKNI